VGRGEGGEGKEFLPEQQQGQGEGFDSPVGGGQGRTKADVAASDSLVPALATVTERDLHSDSGAHLGDKRGRGGGLDGGLRGLKCMRLERPDFADLKEGTPFQHWAQAEVRECPSPDSVLPAVAAELQEASPTLRGDSQAAAAAGANARQQGPGGKQAQTGCPCITEGQKHLGERLVQGPSHRTASPPSEPIGFVNSRGAKAPWSGGELAHRGVAAAATGKWWGVLGGGSRTVPVIRGGLGC